MASAAERASRSAGHEAAERSFAAGRRHAVRRMLDRARRVRDAAFCAGVEEWLTKRAAVLRERRREGAPFRKIRLNDVPDEAYADLLRRFPRSSGKEAAAYADGDSIYLAWIDEGSLHVARYVPGEAGGLVYEDDASLDAYEATDEAGHAEYVVPGLEAETVEDIAEGMLWL